MKARHPVTAIYPGSFDPITNGHLDVINRCCKLFDRVIVGVLVNVEKRPLFTVRERVGMLRTATAAWKQVSVDTFDGLLVEYARRKKAQVIVRGIRAVSDYEYEFQMALMNRRLDCDIETVFLMPAESYSYLSSHLVKEVYLLGGSVRGLVPPSVEKALARKIKSESAPGVRKRGQ
jgi:pantetheine-phosphate adenylyltransferase